MTQPSDSPPPKRADPSALPVAGKLTVPLPDPWATVSDVQSSESSLASPQMPLPKLSAAMPDVAGYEIEAILGRGGMGIVYKARHLALKRTVALKMILAGSHADEDDRRRFRSEAEAVARLQHPGIVQVYEVGEHAGLPFFSLEYCRGGSLAAKVRGNPLTAPEAARLCEALARAVQVAHQAQIIHRDLKPANVLLAEDGTPKVTDFGLARKLDEPGQTQTGAVMGTPSYMAPEQASGKTREIGPATDVYALGAVLYELLSGRPPFKAATAWDTIAQVLADEPVPVRQLQSHCPRDLETICHKCLQKEPARRYATAAALADDLGRFRAGEPIQARPAGRLNKTVMWGRRNPVVAGLIALSVALLLGGTTGITWSYLDAIEQAAEATRQTKIARDKEADALAARAELEKAFDDLEQTLAGSLLGPVSLQGGPLTDREIKSFADLAASRSKTLGYRFIEDALRGPVTTRQLRQRAEVALHAAVGLRSDRRSRVERLLRQHLQDPNGDDEQRTNLALLAVALRDLTPTTRELAARALTQAMGKPTEHPLAPGDLGLALVEAAADMEPRDAAATLSRGIITTTDPQILQALTSALIAVADRLGPGDAAQAVPTLIQAMNKMTDPGHQRALAPGLSAVAARLAPGDAGRLCSQAAANLTQTIGKTTEPFALHGMALGLSALAARMEPGAAAKTAAPLMAALCKTTDLYALSALAESLSAIATRMTPTDAALSADILNKTISKATDPNILPSLGQVLAALAARLEARDVAPTAATLTQTLGKSIDPDVLRALALNLSAVAALQKPRDAAATLTRALTNMTHPSVLQALAPGVSAVAVRLEPGEAAQLCSRAAAALTEALSKTSDPLAVNGLTQSLPGLATRLEPKDAAQTAAVLLQVMNKNQLIFGPDQALAAVAVRMDPRDAAQTVGTLTRALVKETDPSHLAMLQRSIAAMAVRLAPKEAGEAATIVAKAMRMPREPSSLQPFYLGLRGLAPRLDARDAAQVSATLTEAMSKTTDATVLRWLGHGLSEVAPRMEPGAAAVALTRTIGKSTDRAWLMSLGSGMVAVAARMGPDEARQAAATLSGAFAKETNPDVLQALVSGLRAMAARMTPREAAVVLTENMTRTKDLPALQALALGLAQVPARGHMEAREAARTAVLFVQALSRKSPSLYFQPFPVGPSPAQGLADAAVYLEPRDVAQIAAAIIRAMSDTTEPDTLAALARGLSALAGRLEARGAAQAAATLSRAMSKTADPNLLQALAESLAGVAARMEPGEAAPYLSQAATHLTQAMGKAATGFIALPGLADGLAAIVTRVDPTELLQRRAALVAAIGSLTGPGPPAAPALLLGPAREPWPCPFATPELVELLKQPTCVGQARRLILDQLENRYQRPFSDHWAFVRFATEQGLGLDFSTPPPLVVLRAGAARQ